MSFYNKTYICITFRLINYVYDKLMSICEMKVLSRLYFVHLLHK